MEYESIIKKNKNIEYEEEEEEEEINKKTSANNFKLLIIKKSIVEFNLMFPSGDVVAIENLPLKNQGKKIYDLFYISKL